MRDEARFEAPASLDELQELMTELAIDPPDLLAINGGDGTVHKTLTAAARSFETLPTIAILPGGTMDIAARSTGWLGRPLRAWDHIVSGDVATTERSLMQIDTDHFGFLFGNGLLSSFLDVYEEKPNPTVARAAGYLARGVGSALVGGPFAKRLTKRWRGSVIVDDERLQGDDWLAVAAGGVEQIGLGFRPFRMAEAGGFHAIALGCPVTRFATELPRVYRRQPLADARNIERKATRMRLVGEEPSVFMIDGDLYRGDREVHIQLGPTVRFLVPARG